MGILQTGQEVPTKCIGVRRVSGIRRNLMMRSCLCSMRRRASAMMSSAIALPHDLETGDQDLKLQDRATSSVPLHRQGLDPCDELAVEGDDGVVAVVGVVVDLPPGLL